MPGARDGNRFWLVRHGETEGNSSVRFHGSNDVALSDAGRAQIRALAPLVRGLRPRLVVHSPLVRAVESARILIESAGLEPESTTADERLREISFGDCEGLTRDEIHARYPDFWQRHERNEIDAFPGGESRSGFRRRVAAAIAELMARHETGDVVIVAHRGIVRVGLRHLLSLPEDRDDPFGVRLGSLSVVRRDGPGAVALEICDFVP